MEKDLQKELDEAKAITIEKEAEILDLKLKMQAIEERLEKLESPMGGSGIYLDGVAEYYRESILKEMKERDKR